MIHGGEMLEKIEPRGDLHDAMAGIGRHLHNESLALKAINDRLLAIESQTKKPRSRVFTRYLLAICIGVAAALAWQSYGHAAKEMFAAKAPELGWSPESKRMIANLVKQSGWSKPLGDDEMIALHPSVSAPQVATVAQTVQAVITSQAPATPPIDSAQVQQIAADLAALGQTVDQLAVGQDQIGRNVERLQGAVAEILVKMPEPPSPVIAAAPAHKPTPVTPLSSRAPVPTYIPPHP